MSKDEAVALAVVITAIWFLAGVAGMHLAWLFKRADGQSEPKPVDVWLVIFGAVLLIGALMAATHRGLKQEVKP